jgi:hypothetical protein
MKNNILPTVGVSVPSSFPSKHYKAIDKRVTGKKDDNLKAWNEYAGAWKALAYRYKSCEEYNKKFSDSISSAGSSPQFCERYKQERDLFNFFVTGLSVIDSLFYGLYAIASFINPEIFPISDQKDLRNIKPESTKDKYKKVFAGEKITEFIQKLISNKEYSEWKEVRNILAHRVSPPRHFYNGGDNNGKVYWLNEILIDENTTSTKYNWLTDQISKTLSIFDNFTESEFKKMAGK